MIYPQEDILLSVIISNIKDNNMDKVTKEDFIKWSEENRQNYKKKFIRKENGKKE